jgi:hypothetical protein
MKVFIVLSNSKVHSVCDTEHLAERHLNGLRQKCGLVPGYDCLWKKEYRIESVELNKTPKLIQQTF